MVEVHVSTAEKPVDTLPVLPDGSIVEQLEWLTDILQNADGSEQRISIRTTPRRSFAYTLQIQNDIERKALYDVLYNAATNDFFAPAYPYQAYVKRRVPIGERTIPCNTARSDLRPNDSFLAQTRDGKQAIYTVESLTTFGVTIARDLEFPLPRGSIIMPVYLSRLQAPSLSMRAVAGSSTLTANIHRPRAQEAWPSAPVVLPTFDGIVLLDKRPLGSDAPETFESDIEVIDNATGLPAYYSSWLQRYVSGGRSYLINTMFDREGLQFWRTFLDYCRGRQRAFLTPTYRNDQYLADGYDLTPDGMMVKGNSYVRFYADSNTYRRLEIETDRGIFRVVVASASYMGVGTLISFVNPINADLDGASVIRVSYLILARLGNDMVTLTHEDGFTTVDTSLRAAVE
jgi:hypothetical protein